jgi:hypothetical protein
LNPYNVLPVWSFDGPSRHDGFIVWFALRTYWLVTVSGFQGSDCGGFPAYPAVLSAAHQPIRVQRQGDTLRTRVCGVNRFLRSSWASVWPIREGDPGTKNAPGNHLRRRANGVGRTASRFRQYRFVSLRHSVFNTRSSLPEQPAVRWSNVPVASRVCKSFPEGSV